MGQPNKASNEPNRRRSSSDSSIRAERSLHRYPLPDWALPRPDYDIASCSSDDDHERLELDDRKGYRRARRRKLRVRQRRAAKNRSRATQQSVRRTPIGRLYAWRADGDRKCAATEASRGRRLSGMARRQAYVQSRARLSAGEERAHLLRNGVGMGEHG